MTLVTTKGCTRCLHQARVQARWAVSNALSNSVSTAGLDIVLQKESVSQVVEVPTSNNPTIGPNDTKN
jgi:hypothetical protein